MIKSAAVIDEDPSDLWSLCLVFKELGITAYPFSDFDSFALQFPDLHPEAIFCNVLLEQDGGLGVLELVRSSHAKTPVVFTGRKNIVGFSGVFGAAGVLTAPYNISNIGIVLQRIESAMKTNTRRAIGE